VTGREKRFLVAGAAVAVACALVTLYLSLPYIQSRREQAARKRVQEHLKEVGIARHLYADDIDRVPDKKGSPSVATVETPGVDAKSGPQKQEP
jgi:hypothetical protein